jgi:hypothetical protein
MRVMQKTFKTIQNDMKTRPVRGADIRTQVIQQRLYFTPMYIPADWVMEDGKQQAIMFAAHGGSPQ